jgi:hypothetical protein
LLIWCLVSAVTFCFISFSNAVIDLAISPLSNTSKRSSTPLNSPSIQKYLDSLNKNNQVVCLVFDQFEELYSKPELFSIFKAAKDLMLDVAGCKRNFVLGFAWKTDSTTQQDHPAYHMWHELADHRREYRLDVFDKGEIAKSITAFEKEIKQKVTAETRHQISNSSQGFLLFHSNLRELSGQPILDMSFLEMTRAPNLSEISVPHPNQQAMTLILHLLTFLQVYQFYGVSKNIYSK